MLGKEQRRDGWSATQNKAGANALGDAEREEPAELGRRGTQDERDGADEKTCRENKSMTEKVAEFSENKHQAAIGQNITYDDPSDIFERHAEGPCNVRECDVNRAVERADQSAKAKHQKPKIAARVNRHWESDDKARCEFAGECIEANDITRTRRRGMLVDEI